MGLSLRTSRHQKSHQIVGFLASSLSLLFGSYPGCGCGGEHLRRLGEPPVQILQQTCTNDADCANAELCLMGECVPSQAFYCEGGKTPLLSMSLLSVVFGNVHFGESETHTINVENIGDCALTVSAVGLSTASSRDFSCAPCDTADYPLVLLPNHGLEIAVTYTAQSVGEANGALLVDTDDGSAGEAGRVRVDLHALYTGVAKLVLEPSEVDFGYAAYDPDAATARYETVRVMNEGTGNALLSITYIYLSPGADFFLPETFASISPANPVLLPPYDPADPSTWIDVSVRFSPSRYANQESMLTVHAEGKSDMVDASARLSGSSLGPSAIVVSPLDIAFRADDNSPMRLGTSAFRQVDITNTGESELMITLNRDDLSADFALSPGFLAPIYPGASAAVGIYYTPSQASDPNHPGAPERSSDALLRIESNDPDHPITIVSLHGWAQGDANDDLLHIEMVFDNDSGSWAKNDFRNVDVELESPHGMVCRKGQVTYAQASDGTYVPAERRDFCAEWSARADEGTAVWIPGGVYEEPERITLFDLGDKLAVDGIFTVRVYYVEDCANMPTSGLGDLLGIGTSTLLAVLGGTVGIPVAVDPGAIGNLIGENCWEHAATTATVHVFVGNEEIAAPKVRLAAKGDYQEVVKLRRHNSSFTIWE